MLAITPIANLIKWLSLATYYTPKSIIKYRLIFFRASGSEHVAKSYKLHMITRCTLGWVLLAPVDFNDLCNYLHLE